MATLANLARMNVSGGGTGTITLIDAPAGSLTFAQAGVPNGATISYSIVNGYQVEVGRGVYNSTAQTVTRGPLFSTNGNAAINIAGDAQVFITALAEDFADKLSLTGGTLTGEVAFNKNLSSSNQLLDLQQGYVILSDNVGIGGTNNTRLWFTTPTGGDVVFGPRAGSDYGGQFLIKSTDILFDFPGGLQTPFHTGNFNPALKADLASPALTGTPTAPSAAAGRNDAMIANTNFVTTALALKANLASPAFTGTPTAPTQAAGNNTTRLATTAFVKTADDAVVAAQATINNQKLDKTGGLVSGTVDFNKTLSAGNKLLGLMQGYDIFSDNIGDGSANSRLWLDAPNGGQIIVGPRGGTSYLHEVLIRTSLLSREGPGGAENRVLDVSDLATLFTQMGAVGNNAANGYFKLPPPLPAMLQYGIVTPASGVSDFTLSWPTSFPTACRAAIAMPIYNNSGTNEFAAVNLSNLGTSSCTCRTRYMVGTGPVSVTSAMPIAFIALGY